MKPWSTSIVFYLISVLGLAVCPQTLCGQVTSTGSWTQLSVTGPPPLQGSAIVYDAVHNQTVLFGGEDSSGVLHHDTWVFNGTTWTQLNPAVSPGNRRDHAMVFDPATGQVFLFGGESAVSPLTPLGDTWVWNGSNWTKVASSGPNPRRGAAMAYDPVRNRVVLFGGYDGTTLYSDTWAWNGSSWQELPVTGPLPRQYASASFDEVNGVTVLFGGDDTSVANDETWIWDGTTWSQLSPAHHPAARSNQGQAWDPLRQCTVLFGGSNNNDTWIWNGSDWESASPSSNLPPARSYVNLTYDIQHDNMVLFGGLAGSVVLGDTWTLGLIHTENWTLLNLATSGEPPARSFAAAVYGNDAFIFGGTNGSTALADTWNWIGDEWVAYGGSAPPGRSMAAIAYDALHQNVVMFGGDSNPTVDIPLAVDTPLGDTWIYASGTWTNTGAAGPLAREGAAMVYDALHKNTVLFGGYAGGTTFRDTWIWNGSTWNQQSPGNPPPARYLHSMVFDSTHNQVLMFGGISGSGDYMYDTWTWDGMNWTQLSPANHPSPRCAFAMVYDTVHGRVVLSDGLNSSGALNDTWAWDGVNWTELTPATSPTSRYGAAAAFVNSPVAQFLLFGGNNGTANLNDTWVWASPYLASAILPEAVYNQPYSYTLAPAGGVPPYTFHQDGIPYSFASLGLILDPNTGAITGTMDASPGQTIPFGVTILDAQGQQTDLVVTITSVSSPLTLLPTSLPDATAGTNYLVQVSATGGLAPYTFSAAGLPSGLSLNSSNQIVGNCTASSSDVTIEVTDSASMTVSLTGMTLYCNPAPQITNTSPLPSGLAGTPYSVQFMTNAVYDPPGAAPYTWSLTRGTLPAVFTLSSSGMLSGIPTTSSMSNFSVTFTDRWGASNTKEFALTVNQAPVFTGANSAVFTIGVAGSFTVTTAGYPTPSLTEMGHLPSDLTFVDNGNGTATLSGTPTVFVGGDFPITFTAKNGIGSPATQAFTIILQQAPSFTSANNAVFVYGVPNSFTVTTVGFPVPSIHEAGTLPPWLTFVDNGNGTATLAGTPSYTSGTFALVLTATNVVASVQQNFTLSVSGLNLSPSNLVFGTVYLNSSHTLPVTVTNVGSATVSISGVSITPGTANAGAYTAVNHCTSPLKSGKSCTIDVTFKANAEGTLTATLNLMDNAVGMPQLVGLTGNVIDPVAQFSPTKLAFGTVTVHNSKTLPVQLTNSGQTPLDISNISIGGADAGDFSQTNNCPAILAASTSCTISVTFDPTVKGARTGTLIVTDNVASGQSTVALTGTGH
ncbi:MAG: choice-of-anchor D domain-containing protein [Terriglobales bacterium]